MTQTVRDWMITPVIVVQPEASVDETVRIMQDRGIHNVIVDISSQNGRGHGIVTITDIYNKIIAPNRNPLDVSTAEIMTAPIECAEADWTLSQAAELMHKVGVHYLPVLDKDASLVGVISASVISIAAEALG